MEIRLRGGAEAILGRGHLQLSDATSADDVVRHIAAMDEELHRQLLREDGTPRQSARVLIDGRPAESLSAPIPTGAIVTVSPIMSCDG
jgi:hypothetical protein